MKRYSKRNIEIGNMLTADFSFKQGDIGKTITGQFIERQSDGAQIVQLDPHALTEDEIPVNCTDAEGRIVVCEYSAGTLMFVGTVEFSEVGELRAEGKFTFRFSDANLAIDDGWYKTEFKLLIGNEEIRTFPTDPVNPYLLLYVAPSLATVALDGFGAWGEPPFGSAEVGGEAGES